ncbi:ATP-binding protein [Kitasatospora sp. NPDC048365]|uniref:ATP-binding protein n=1 Tax=Kitasatospora sp. NPDC048365 TaxID=3364050 RepID=UPI003718F812
MIRHQGASCPRHPPPTSPSAAADEPAARSVCAAFRPVAAPSAYCPAGAAWDNTLRGGAFGVVRRCCMSGSGAGSPASHRTGFAFVGREVELRQLLAAVGEGATVVLVEGEAGIGKSRLLREAADRLTAAGVPVLQGGCHPLREPLPFGPLVDALRDGSSWFGPVQRFSPATAVLAPYLPELADRLPAMPAGGGFGTPGQQLMRAVHDALRDLGPVVLMVEDLHWADDGTRDLLSLLARNPPEQLRLVLTYRAHDLRGGRSVLGSPYRRPLGVGGTEIALRPLPEEEVRRLAVSVIGPAAAGSLCRELFERSGGLPLAAEEDLLVLADRLARAGGGGVPLSLEDAQVPRALQEAVNSRVDPLGHDARAVVQAAAVLAVPAREEVLSAMTSLTDEQTEQALTDALGADVLVERAPGRYGFRHVLARRAVYDTIPGPRLRRLHGRAADVLSREATPALVQVAHHTRRLGDIAAWLPRARAAAEHAVAVGDNGIAANLLQQLLAEPELPAEARTRSALDLSRIVDYMADPRAGIALLRRILADPALDVVTRGEIRLHLGLLLFFGADVRAAATAELERAIGELRDRPDLAAVAMASLGLRTSTGMTIAERLGWMERATASIAHSDNAVARATVLASRISLLASLGDREADVMLRQLPRDDPDRDVQRQCARALHNAADAMYLSGNDERSRVLLAEAEGVARRIGNPSVEAGCGAIALKLDLAGGRWTGLEDRIETLMSQAVEGHWAHVEARLVRGRLDLAHGRWARAREVFTFLMTEEHGEIFLLGAASLARTGLLEEKPEDAWEVGRLGVRELRERGGWVWATDLVPTAVEAALACDLVAEAERLVADAAAGTAGCDTPGAEAEIAWSRGLLAAKTAVDDGDGLAVAVRHLDDARLRYSGIGRPYHAALVCAAVGRILVPHHPQQAAARLEEAFRAFTHLGALADSGRCEQLLRTIGRHRAQPRDRRTYGTDLSPREQQVVRLLVDGATNLDIARALGISTRTAEHHVASVLRKLQTTRHQLRGAQPPLF